MPSVLITTFWAGAIALSVNVAMAQTTDPSSRTTPNAQETSSQQREETKKDQMGRGKESDWAGQRKQPPETESSRNKTEKR